MSATSFASRLQVGHAAQAELRDMLQRLGFEVHETGQEAWLARAVHERVRHDHADPMVRAVRYAPDLLAYWPEFPLAYWEAKANTTPGTPNFAVERACYQELMARQAKGERVVVAFRETDGKWHANWIQHLVGARDMSADRHAARGSQTPYLLIPKTSTLPIGPFLSMHAIGTGRTT